MAKAKTAALERHPLSEKYGPKMSDDELAGLGQDIKANGQHEPIILHEGKVLAGWNRYLGCVANGIEPKTKPMDKASDPVAVAFGTNFMRRKLSSVQKAFYGAEYALQRDLKQADVAKMMACNLNRLNLCCQLLKAGTDQAKEAIAAIKENADMGGGAFDELMLEAGISRPPRDKHPLDDEPIEDDDLTGGAVDDLLDSEEDLVVPSGGRKPIGDDDAIPEVGTSRTSLKNPQETILSRVAKAFNKLNADDHRQFVKFTWGKLRPALDAALRAGSVEYALPEDMPAPAAAKGKGRKKPVELPAGPPDPSIIARGQPADDTLTPKAPAKWTATGKPPPAKKVAPDEDDPLAPKVEPTKAKRPAKVAAGKAAPAKKTTKKAGKK